MGQFTDHVAGVVKYVTFKANLVKRGGTHIPKGFILPTQKKQFLRWVRCTFFFIINTYKSYAL